MCPNHTILNRPRKSLEERFWPKVQIAASHECWEWLASKTPAGYGKIGIGGRNGKIVGAHRVSYMLYYGNIPPDMVIDHLCRNPSCVNPNHLEAVTRRTNTLRGIGKTIDAHNENRCIHGHELTPENTVVVREQRRGKYVRRCRKCRNAAARRAKRRNHPPTGKYPPAGELNGRSILTEQDVKQIRIRYANGESINDLAQAFGIKRGGIGKIIHRRTWRHVP